jgi:methylthioribose-1-phosphate isomerase
MTLTAIKYDEEEHVLSLLDQRALPTATTYIQCTTSHQVSTVANWPILRPHNSKRAEKKF